MIRFRYIMLLITVCAAFQTAHGGTGYTMKCQAQPAEDPKPGKITATCTFSSRVTFGGGMFFDQLSGYCRACKKFVYVTWTGKDQIDRAKEVGFKVQPRPKPLGEVWDARTGKILTIHACPTCKGPFLEIKSPDELKHCPACNKPHFGVDKSKPVMAID